MVDLQAPAPILYPYQRRYLADASRWKAAMWSRQTGKTFTTTLEAVLDCLTAEAEGRIARWTILSIPATGRWTPSARGQCCTPRRPARRSKC
jgi:phage FluMu gp28-like protein